MRAPKALRWAWTFLLAAMLVFPALAQTPVSGAIAVDTHWTVAQAPYVVSGDVVVQNGAELTIDAGVTVYMAAASSLTVQSGGVVGVGTAADPIRVLSDKVRNAQPGAPGDYKAWTFNPGTTQTRLEHVLFQHGSGLVVKGAAPTFNYLDLRDHQGAAITIDLAASPTGVGNQASGNSVNGIAVPSGDIGGNVQWGLRGIPYVVASGTVSVGASPVVTAIEPNSVQQGETATLTLTGSRLAGLAQVSFGAAGVSAEVLPGGTATQAKIEIAAGEDAPVGPAGMTLLVDAGEAKTGAALTIAPAQPTIVGVAPQWIYVGQGAVSVAINGRGFTSESVAQINGGAIATQFDSATQLHATVPNQTVASNLSLRLRTPDPANPGQYLTSNEVVVQVKPAQIVVTPETATAVKGLTKQFTLTLPYPASSGGLNVNLVSSVPSVASVPATVPVAEGGTTATFNLTAIEVGNTVVTASKSGLVSGQAQVTVIPPPTLSITPNVLNLGVGRQAQITLQSSIVAPESGIAVSLSSSDGSIATVPATAVIPAGGTTASATVSTSALGTATLQATASEHVPATATVNVRPVSITLPAGALVSPGLSRSIPMTLSDPAPEGGLVVTLESSNTAAATVPASITVPAGEVNANFTLTGVAAGVANVAATAPGYQAASLPVTVEVVTIGVGLPPVGSISLPAETALNYPVTLSRPAPAGGVVVNLSTADPAVATVSPATIAVAEGETSGGTQQLTVSGVSKASTTLIATADGLGSANIPVNVTGKAELRFYLNSGGASIVVGKGLNNYAWEIYLYRYTDNQTYSPNVPLTVNLTSSDPSKLKVPATVTIPAGYAYVNFTVTGVDLTNGTPVTIDAAATGYTSPTVKPTVTVVTPQFSFSGIELNRSTASERDNIRIDVSTPGAYGGTSVTPTADMPVDLSIVEADPAGIVAGFYSTASGGTPVTQVVIPADNELSNYFYVGTPTATGSYKIRASSTGIAANASSAVAVTSPVLEFYKNSSNLIVGKGLNNYAWEIYITRKVNGSDLPGAEALTVNLTSSDPSKLKVPATVTIPAGQAYAYFTVAGVDLTDGTPVTIDATAAGYASPAVKLTATVVAPQFGFSGMELNRSTASARDDFRIDVNTPGAYGGTSVTPAADMPVDLSIVEADPAGVVDGFYSAASGGTPVTQVVIPAGSELSNYVYAGTPTATGSYKVQASSTGIAANASSAVTVAGPVLEFYKNSSNLIVGKGLNNYAWEIYITRKVNGSDLPGAEALTVNLTSSDPSKLKVPATVTIPAGQAYAYFTVAGVDLTDGTPVTIDATAAGYASPAVKLTATVVAPQFGFSGMEFDRSIASARDEVRIDANTPGAYGGTSVTAAANLPVDLSIVEASPAGIVDGFYSAASGGTPVTQVVIPAGNELSNSFYVGTPTTTGSYKVRANATGVSTATSEAIAVTPPELRFSKPSVVVGKGFKNYYWDFYVYRAVDSQEFNGATALTVNLSCSSTAICMAPATVTIPQGQSSVYVQISGVGLGNTTVTASAVGHNAIGDLDVSVVTPQLALVSLGSITVGQTDNVYVRADVPGAYGGASVQAVAPISVTLTSSAPEVATVTSPVTIPQDSNSSGYAALTGVSAGTTTITASGSGMAPASSDVTISP